MQRRSKQFLIIFLYLILLGSFFSIIFFAFFYQKATCVDEVQNQDETGVDCGGSCSEFCLKDLASEPVVISEVEALAFGENSVDAIATVTNKNAKAGLKNAEYRMTLFDQSGSVLAEKRGNVSLLPFESRTLSVLGIATSFPKVARTEFTIENEEWVALTEFTEAPDIRLVNQQFNLLSSEAGFAEAKGLVQNMSPYDIRSLTVVVIPRDASGRALSVNKTVLNTLESGEQRDFRLIWPRAYTGSASRAEMQIHFDLLADDALIQRLNSGNQSDLESQK